MAKKQEYTCSYCGIRVKKYPSQVRGKTFRCAKNCPAYVALLSVNRTCEICHQEFEGPGRFCTEDCREEWFSINFQGVSPKCHTKEKKYSAKRRAIYYQGDEIDRFRLFEMYNWTCHICRRAINPDLRHPDQYAATIDHVIPISKGGTHTWDNVRPAHALCNFLKAADIDIEQNAC